MDNPKNETKKDPSLTNKKLNQNAPNKFPKSQPAMNQDDDEDLIDDEGNRIP